MVLFRNGDLISLSARIFGTGWGLIGGLSLLFALLGFTLGVITFAVLRRIGGVASAPRILASIGAAWGIVAVLVLAVVFWSFQDNPPWTMLRNSTVGLALYGSALYAAWRESRIGLTLITLVLIILNVLVLFSYGPYLFLGTLLLAVAATLLWFNVAARE